MSAPDSDPRRAAERATDLPGEHSGARLPATSPDTRLFAASPNTRLFAAIDPPKAVREALGAICRGLEGARWTRPEQTHVTLRFLGSRPTSLVDTIASALAAVAAESFRMAVTGFGVFPSFRSPRVLWAGLEPPDPVRDLARSVEDALAGTGEVERDEKPFSPHLTLARLNGTRPAALRAWMESREGFAAGPWEVSEFFLYASRLTPQGAIHTRLEAWPLARAGAAARGER